MSGHLHVGNLPRDCREEDVRKLFDRYGDINKVDIKQGGKNDCYAFVYFDDVRDAQKAIEALNDKDYDGGKLSVAFSRKPAERAGRSGSRPPRPELRLKVVNIPRRTDWKDLKDWARIAGGVQYAHVNSGDEPYGVIEFEDMLGYKNALDKLESSPLLGERVRISKDLSEEDKGGGGRGGGGGGRYDDRRGGYDRGGRDSRGGGGYGRGYDSRDSYSGRDSDLRGGRYSDDRRSGPPVDYYEGRGRDGGRDAPTRSSAKHSRSRSRSRDGARYGGGSSYDSRGGAYGSSSYDSRGGSSRDGGRGSGYDRGSGGYDGYRGSSGYDRR